MSTTLISLPFWLCPFVVLGIIWAFVLAWFATALLVNTVGYIAARFSS